MWAEAFWLQAKSDWQMYNKLEQTNESDCYVLHYLQMATEKLGKAYLLYSGIGVDDVQNSHRAFTSFLRNIARNSYLQEKLGMNAAQLRAHIYQILPMAHAIEKLAPALASGGVNPEYPWQNPDGSIIVQIRYRFNLLDILEQKRGRDLVKLVKIVLDNLLVLHITRRKGAK